MSFPEFLQIVHPYKAVVLKVGATAPCGRWEGPKGRCGEKGRYGGVEAKGGGRGAVRPKGAVGGGEEKGGRERSRDW